MLYISKNTILYFCYLIIFVPVFYTLFVLHIHSIDCFFTTFSSGSICFLNPLLFDILFLSFDLNIFEIFKLPNYCAVIFISRT